MSNSADAAAAQEQQVVGSPAATTAVAATKSPSPPGSQDALPKSSPPLPSLDLSVTTLPSAARQDTGDPENEAEDGNDSEAETLISSPVKKREMLKHANEASLERVEEEGLIGEKTIPTFIVEGDVGSNPVRRDGQDEGMGEGVDPHDDATKEEQVEDGGNESDKLSEVRSSFSSSGSQSELEGSQLDAEFEGIDEEDDGRVIHVNNDATIEENESSANPRKRKHRDSYMPVNMEPPRRRRRASDLGNTQSRENAVHSSGEASSSPQLRRQHRRTISTQSSWTDPSRNNGDHDPLGGSSGRQRRAATHFPLQEVKTRNPTWDSDTSSETSHQHHQSRLTRNLNRSVSTPGRPMGRDHKRHVNKYGFTHLAQACESGELDQVKEWREKDPVQLEQREFAGNTPLQVASLNGYPEIVSYLLQQGCDPHCANTDKDTPLIDAVENGHIDCVRLLLKAGVDPLRQNLKGQQALDVVTDDTENSLEIRTALREAIEDWTKNERGEQQRLEEEPAYRPGPTKGLQFMARTYENLMKLVSDNDREGVQEFLDARVPVDNAIVAAGAKTGDTFTVSMLLAEMTPKKARQRPEKPMLAVIGTSHFDMVKFLTDVDQFNPTWKSKSNGMTWHELAEHRRGPKWRQEKELLKKLYDEKMNVNRLSSSPVHRRENGKKRRRSPGRSRDSDVEMDDADFPDQSRNRRRLVSKKVMRVTSNRRSSSTSSSSEAPTNPDDSALNSSDSEDIRPPVPRKVGRPRKISTASHLSEPQPKRRRSSSLKERVTVSTTSRTNTLPDTAEEVLPLEKDQSIKLEEAERQKAEEEEKAKVKQQADLEAKLEAEKLAEEARRAEAARKEEEESRRREAERKAKEMRIKHEQQVAEERRIKKEAQLFALPSALRQVISLADSAKQEYIQRHFLPIQVVKSVHLGSPAGGEGKDDLWMLNYQAAAILTGKSATDLLGLIDDPTTQPSHMSGIATKPVTKSQRQIVLPCLQPPSLVHKLVSGEQYPEDDLVAEIAAVERFHACMQEDRAKFLSMPSLQWIRLSDFYNAASSPECKHLSGLSLDMRFDCCFDTTPFDVDGPEPSFDGKVFDGMNGTKFPDSGVFVNGGDRSPAGPGVTTLAHVQD